MRVRYSVRAARDLTSILEYLNDRSPRGARNLKRAVDRTLTLISQFPEIGKLEDEEGTRVLPAGRYPYLIYWLIEDGEAWIVHIRDGRRRPWRDER